MPPSTGGLASNYKLQALGCRHTKNAPLHNIRRIFNELRAQAVFYPDFNILRDFLLWDLLEQVVILHWVGIERNYNCNLILFLKHCNHPLVSVWRSRHVHKINSVEYGRRKQEHQSEEDRWLQFPSLMILCLFYSSTVCSWHVCHRSFLPYDSTIATSWIL